MNERTDYNKHEGNYEKTSEGNYEKTLKLEKKSWLWLLIRYQQLLGILHISHSNNVYVGSNFSSNKQLIAESGLFA